MALQCAHSRVDAHTVDVACVADAADVPLELAHNEVDYLRRQTVDVGGDAQWAPLLQHRRYGVQHRCLHANNITRVRQHGVLGVGC